MDKQRLNSRCSTAPRDEAGQNLLEFALLSVLLLFIVLAIFGFSMIFGAHLSLNLATNTAARYAAVEDWGLLDCSGNYDLGIYDEIVGSLIFLNPSNIEEIKIYQMDPLDGSMTEFYNTLNGAGGRVYENYGCALRTRGTYLGVRVTYTQPVIVPFLSAIMGEETEIIKAATFRIQ